MSWSVWISDPLDASGVARLQANPALGVTIKTDLNPEAQRIEIAKHDVLIVRSGTTVDEALLKPAKNLKLIVRAGSGVDNIDIPYARKQGIAVCNTPGTNANAAAEHTVALMFALLRHVPQAYESLQQGQWNRSQYMGHELKNKRLGLIGFGYVGQRVAQMALGIGMDVGVLDPFAREKSPALRWYDTLEALLCDSDVISLHAAVPKADMPLLRRDHFAQMKKGAWLINTARAALLDTTALAQALADNRLAGAALDVLDQEPPKPDDPLLNHPKVIVTPHLGASTFEAQQAVVDAVVHVVEAFIKDGRELHPVG